MTNTNDLAAALKLLNVPADIAAHIVIVHRTSRTEAEAAEELEGCKGGGYGGDQLRDWYTSAITLAK